MPDEFEGVPERYEEPPAFFPDEGAAPERGNDSELIEVAIEGIYKSATAGQISHYVMLSDDVRKLPILIGPGEASSIGVFLNGGRNDRPGTHDLTKIIVERLDAIVDRVVIDDFWNGVYYAKVFLTKDNDTLEVDARPSDAIALAVRFDAPVYVSDNLLEMVPEV